MSRGNARTCGRWGDRLEVRAVVTDHGIARSQLASALTESMLRPHPP